MEPRSASAAVIRNGANRRATRARSSHGPTRASSGKVKGRRLKRGTYLLTYRALRKRRVLSISGSIRFTVTKSGKFVNLRRQRYKVRKPG